MIGIIIATGASVAASLVVVQVAVLPLLFKYSKSVPRKMVFSNCINCPANLDYENPASCSVVGGRSFKIQFVSKVDECPIELGVWHIAPISMLRDLSPISLSVFEDRLQRELTTTKNTVVVYCHGNANHRASPHRLLMYKVFQQLDFHVIAFDYRGYGDSTRIRPTERGVVEDLYQVYAWLISTLNKESTPAVLLWGHSLGTAVIANMSANLLELCSDGEQLPPPAAIVLEAPFTNLTEEVQRHPFSKFVSWLPYYKDTFLKPFTNSSEYAFTTDDHLTKVPQLPILILHSKADKIVPYDLGVKLHSTLAKARFEMPDAAPLVFHSFDSTLGIGHNSLCVCPLIKNVVSDFLKTIRKE
ncbi:hypothetical protein ACJJTC_000310 [Scirpophaga incertulas]